MSAPIVERLRAYRPYRYDGAGKHYALLGNPCGEAASTIETLLAALEHVVEYWNRDQNETAMADALWHIIETAEATIAKIEGGAA